MVAPLPAGAGEVRVLPVGVVEQGDVQVVVGRRQRFDGQAQFVERAGLGG
jgi:hypothetical protein